MIEKNRMMKLKRVVICWLLGNCFPILTLAQSVELNQWVQSLGEDPKTLIKKAETKTHYFAFFNLTNNVVGIYASDEKRDRTRLKAGKTLWIQGLEYNFYLTDEKGRSVVDNEAALGTDYHFIQEKALAHMDKANGAYLCLFPIFKCHRGMIKILYREVVEYEDETEHLIEWRTSLVGGLNGKLKSE